MSLMTVAHAHGAHPFQGMYEQEIALRQTPTAAPIVVGAAALVQNYYKSTHNHPLNSLEMRTLLRNTGRPQPGLLADKSNNIGPLPNVAAALNSQPITPSILANGQAGSISVPRGAALNITMSMNAGAFQAQEGDVTSSRYGIPSDWFYAVNWNGAWYYYAAADSAWYPFAVRWFASNVYSYGNYTAFSSPIYGAGTYTFYLIVDTKQDAALFNIDGSLQPSAYWKSVTVNVY